MGAIKERYYVVLERLAATAWDWHKNDGISLDEAVKLAIDEIWPCVGKERTQTEKDVRFFIKENY